MSNLGRSTFFVRQDDICSIADLDRAPPSPYRLHQVTSGGLMATCGSPFSETKIQTSMGTKVGHQPLTWLNTMN
jgi:hypothetical protein